MLARFSSCKFLAIPVLLLGAITAAGQTAPITGNPPLSSITGGPFDSINLANFNVHFSIPVFSRSGKEIPFSYALTYDSLMWGTYVDTSGFQHWAPTSTFGWTDTTSAATGYVSNSYALLTCGTNGQGQEEKWSNFVYHDPAGTSHPFSPAAYIQLKQDNTPGCTSHTFTSTLATDNSGYTLSPGTVDSGNPTIPATIVDTNGITYHPPYDYGDLPGSVVDPNGNQLAISLNKTSITDTLNTTVLSLDYSIAHQVTYSYTAPSGAQAKVKVTYVQYSVQTNFNVFVNGNRIIEYGPLAQYLVDTITLPDNSSYHFAYEGTAGITGKTTGRIASVTLPTGGTITYTYTSAGCANSLNCILADGGPNYMTRVLAGGTWQYSRGYQIDSSHPSQTTTTVVDPAGNYTDLKFSSVYETERTIWSGARSSVLDYSYNCYNTNTYDPSCPAATITTPITTKYHNDHMNVVSFTSTYSSLVTTYDASYGTFTSEADKDFGTFAVLRAVNIVNSGNSGAPNHSLCTTYNICNAPASIQVTDGSSQKAYTTYIYDEGGTTHGNATTISKWVSSTSSNLNQHYSYNAGGTVATATDPKGTVTTYSYAGTSCNNAFPTSVTVAGLTTQYAYNCTGAVVTSATDPNTVSASASYTDAYFWRPASTTDQLSNVTNYSYYPTLSTVGQVESSMTFNSGQSTADTIATLDSLGRPWLQQKRQAPGSTTFDTVDTEYDSSGRIYSVTLPFPCGLGQGQGSCTASKTTTTYDAAGRATQVTDAGNGTTSYSYNLNDGYITVGPAPSGENTKRRQLEYDALGRLKSVCEITTGTGSGACGQQTAANGYLTSYTYDPLGNLTAVGQSGQTRTFTFDGVSRMLSETHPETSTNGSGGITHYVYDSACSVNSPGDMIQRTDNAGNVSCYGRDSLHRVTSVGYSGPNAANTPTKYFIYDSGGAWGLTQTNVKGRLSAAYTFNTSTQLQVAQEAFSYDARGQATDYWQATPNSGGWYHMVNTYAANGVTVSRNGYVGTGTTRFAHALSYAIDGEGRPSGSTDQTSSTTIWSGTTYNPLGQPLQATMGSTAESFGYDANTGRVTQWQSTGASKTDTGVLTWNANGTLGTLAITDGFNSPNTQTCTYSYDDLGRVGGSTGVLCKNSAQQTIWQQTFGYDALGNISKTGTANFNPGYGAGNHANGFTYDADGNVLTDGANTYVYDAEGRAVTVAGVQTTFDAFNRAVEQNRSGVHQQIVYSPTGEKFAFMNGQSVTSYLVPFVGGLQAVYNSSGLNYYQHVDWLGSSRLSLTSAGAIKYGRAYAPFGEVYAEYANIPTGHSFTGQTQDTTAGLYDFLFRQQSAAQGRWLVPDPAGTAAVDPTNPQTWNRYAYVGNNPLSFIDPLGLCGSAAESWDGNSNTITADGPCQILPLDPTSGRGYGGFQVEPGGGGGGGGGGRRCDLMPLLCYTKGQPAQRSGPVASQQPPTVTHPTPEEQKAADCKLQALAAFGANFASAFVPTPDGPMAGQYADPSDPVGTSVDIGRKGLALFKNPGVRAIVLNQAVQVGKQVIPLVADVLDVVPGVDAFAAFFQGAYGAYQGTKAAKEQFDQCMAK